MTWHAFHDRGEILRHVAATADDRRDGVLPMDVPGVAANFADELDLLSALMLKWHARLSGNIERALAGQPMDLEAAVAAAWQRTAQLMPGVRMVIDRSTAQPGSPTMAAAVARAQEREWIRLAAAAGLANDEGPAAAGAGERLEARARLLTAQDLRAAGVEPAPVGPTATASTASTGAAGDRPSLVERIRAVLAA